MQHILKAEFRKKIKDVLENGYKGFINAVKYALSWGLNCLVFREFTAKILLLKVKLGYYLVY